MATFQERFLHFLQVTDPRTLLTSAARSREAATVLRRCKEQGLQCGSESEMRDLRRIVDATTHPVTGLVIPAPFRVSAIAPVNIPLVYMMLTTPASNVPFTLFLHWLNQSYNTACNFYNSGGGGTGGRWEETAKAYVLATASACTLAFGLGKAMERAPASVRRFGVVIPCLATAAANCSNLGITRMGELTQGAPLLDESGRSVGLSPKAGMVCVAQTALTRCVLVPAACLLLPPVAIYGLRSLRLVPTGPRALVVLELAIIYASLQAALPAALAVFPQAAAFPVSALEKRFHALKDQQGRPIHILYANKGL